MIIMVSRCVLSREADDVDHRHSFEKKPAHIIFAGSAKEFPSYLEPARHQISSHLAAA
jgi:hypothetical protein